MKQVTSIVMVVVRLVFSPEDGGSDFPRKVSKYLNVWRHNVEDSSLQVVRFSVTDSPL
jgi:hypothetical protein